MYLQLFRRTEQALRILEQAQQEAELQYLAQDAPPLHLAGAPRGEKKHPPVL